MIPLKDNVFGKRFPFVTLALILLNVAIFIYELTLSESRITALIDHFGLSSTNISPITLISYQFLHGGFVHVIGNMIYLWVFGNNVEDRLGPFYFLLFYLASGVAGGLLQTVFSHDALPIIGASASVAGILGAYLVWFPRSQVKLILPIFIIWTVVTVPASLLLVFWFFTNLLNSYGSIVASELSGVAYLGHVGGFIFGVVLGLLLRRPSQPVLYEPI